MVNVIRRTLATEEPTISSFSYDGNLSPARQHSSVDFVVVIGTASSWASLISRRLRCFAGRINPHKNAAKKIDPLKFGYNTIRQQQRSDSSCAYMNVEQQCPIWSEAYCASVYMHVQLDYTVTVGTSWFTPRSYSASDCRTAGPIFGVTANESKLSWGKH